MSQATLRVLHADNDYVDPHPGLGDAPADLDTEPGAVWFAMRAANKVALAENLLAEARRDRADAAADLHNYHGWTFRRTAKLLHVTEGAVRAMIAKYEDAE